MSLGRQLGGRAILTGFAGFVFGKRRQNAETDAVEIENVAKVTELYQKTLDDMGNRYEVKFQQITGLYEDKKSSCKMKFLSLNEA